MDEQFPLERIGLKDFRPLQASSGRAVWQLLALVQFCIVGASGMVIDLSFYALLQFLLSFTWLADRKSALFGSSWHLAIAAAYFDRNRPGLELHAESAADLQRRARRVPSSASSSHTY